MDESFRDDVYVSSCPLESLHVQQPEEVEDRAVALVVAKIVAMNVANRVTSLDSVAVATGHAVAAVRSLATVSIELAVEATHARRKDRVASARQDRNLLMHRVPALVQFGRIARSRATAAAAQGLHKVEIRVLAHIAIHATAMIEYSIGKSLLPT